MCFNGVMAATDPHKHSAQLVRARKLMAAADILVDEAMPDADLTDRWTAAQSLVKRLSNNAWAELAANANITPPSEETIELVHYGMDERVKIMNRHRERNYNNNVTPIR